MVGPAGLRLVHELPRQDSWISVVAGHHLPHPYAVTGRNGGVEPPPVARLIPALGLVAGHRFLTGGPLVGQGRDDVLAVCTGHGKRVIEGAPITLTVGRRHPLEEK